MTNLDLIPNGFFACFPDPPCLFYLDQDPNSLLYNQQVIEYHVYMPFTFLSYKIIISFIKYDLSVYRDANGNQIEEWWMKTIRETRYSKNKETVMLITRHRNISKFEKGEWKRDTIEVKVGEYRESKLNEKHLIEIFACGNPHGITREELLKIIERKMYINGLKE